MAEKIPFETLEEKKKFWHTSSHLLAQAVLELFPDAKRTMGPPIDEGFYYDFYREEPFTPEDLKKIQKKMREISKKKPKVVKKDLSIKEAKEFFKDNKFKLELIDEFGKGQKKLSFYGQSDFLDLCKGGHIEEVGAIKAIKLLKTSAAYWRGDAKKDSLQRIYGISFPEKDMLKDYLHRLEEAEKRDHKKIGRKLDLFMLHELIGKGLPVWLPKGELLKTTVENFAIEMERVAGYKRVSTPHLAKEELFVKSGHLPHYAHSMYPPMVMDDGKYRLKAMNCPLHHLIFSHKPKSYRELPLRIAEYGSVYRNELSGTLSGLLRVRMLSMNDAHIYCTKEQIGQEVKAVIRMIQEYYKVFGFEDYHFRLSLWDPKNKDKYINEPKNWKYAQEQLRKILKELKCEFVEAEDEAAFYGPKIDIQFKTVLGREETMSTVQLDFAAKSRFDLSYAAKDGKENGEVFVIHRAPLSTHERFLAFLIEHYAGNFPLWLNPSQIILLPMADRHLKQCKKLQEEWFIQGLRVSVDERVESMNKKVRDAQMQKYSLMVTVGDKELENNSLAVRTREGKVKFGVNAADFVKKVKENISKKEENIEF